MGLEIGPTVAVHLPVQLPPGLIQGHLGQPQKEVDEGVSQLHGARDGGQGRGKRRETLNERFWTAMHTRCCSSLAALLLWCKGPQVGHLSWD